MEFNTYLVRLDQIINEFLFLNSYFNTKKNSRTFEYDVVFSRWKKDMFSRFREMLIHMHWATSSDLILNNQIILDILFRGDYHFEIRYQFGVEYDLDYKSFLEICKTLTEEYMKFFKAFSYKEKPMISDFEKQFYKWKQNFKSELPANMTFDILWDQTSKKLIENPVLFNMIYKDNFLLQIKNTFADNKNDISFEDDI